MLLHIIEQIYRLYFTAHVSKVQENLQKQTRGLKFNALIQQYRPEVETHQQWREEERQNKLPSPVEHAGKCHGDGSARLVEQLSSDEPGDGARAQFVCWNQAENQQDMQAPQLWNQVLHVA